MTILLLLNKINPVTGAVPGMGLATKRYAFLVHDEAVCINGDVIGIPL